MVRRHGRRAVDPDAPVVDVDRVLADDREIDRIGLAPWPVGPVASGTLRVAGVHRAAGRHCRQTPDESLFELLDEWRLELAGPPMPAMSVARPPARAGATPTRHRRRSWRPVLAVVAAIGAVMVGSATVGAADADLNSPLWPLTKIIWPTRAESIESTRDLQVALDEAREALRSGRSVDARLAIVRAESELGKIDDIAVRDDMASKVSLLRARSTPSALGPWSAQVAIASGPPSAEAPSATGPALAGLAPATAAVSTPAELPGASTAAVVASGSPAGSVAGAVTTAAPASPVAGPVTAGPTASPATSVPAAPATVPDPSVVVVPPSASEPPVSDSPVSSAPQQSAPSPTQTAESPPDVTTSAERSVIGSDSGRAQSPASADDAQAASTAAPPAG